MSMMMAAKAELGKSPRLDFGSESLDELIATVAQRVGADDDQYRPKLLYEDDKGDKVLLTSDMDLAGAVAHAKTLQGQKILRLYLEFPEPLQQEKPEPATEAVKASKWTPFHSGLLAGVAVAYLHLLVFLVFFGETYFGVL